MRPRAHIPPARRAIAAAIGLCALAGLAAFTHSVGAPAGALAALAGVAHAGEALPPPAPPERLSETGLYRADGSIDPRNRPFAPQYPLWTDGADKSRWIFLPSDERIDVSDVDAWRFPEGTAVWKEFAWNGRKVETRMIRAEAGGRWTFATYVWNEEQNDATLAPEAGVLRAFEFAPGRRHSIPGRRDCVACHESGPSRLLGFSALQLSDDRDPLAPHADSLRAGMITLRTLVAERRLSPPRPEFARRPPRIGGADPIERAARGYLSANCGHCHNTRGALARLAFSLQYELAPDGRHAGRPASAIGAHTAFAVPGLPPDSTFAIVPGAPERSAVAYRMASRRPSSQMPPLGTVVADERAIELVRRWIGSLGGGAEGKSGSVSYRASPGRRGQAPRGAYRHAPRPAHLVPRYSAEPARSPD